MKKWSKILAAVLAIALVVCGVVIIATAEGASTPGFKYTGATYDNDGNVVKDASGNIVWSEITGNENFGEAILSAKPDTVITMTGDTTWTFDTGVGGNGAGNPLVLHHSNNPSQGKVTVDLNGYTLTVVQLYKEQLIKLSSQNPLTIKNGTLKVIWADEAKPTEEKSFPLFEVGWGNSEINFENVNTYSGSLVRAIYGEGTGGVPRVNVIGGPHYIVKRVTDSFGGFIESRSNVEFKAEGATFYVADGTYGLISSSHYRRGTLTDKKSTFDFKRCTIIGESITTNFISAANEYTFVHFDDCDIFGSFGKLYWPSTGVQAVGISVHVNDKVNDVYLGQMKPGSIVVGDGSRIATKVVEGEGEEQTTTLAYICNGTTYTVGTKQLETTAIVVYSNTEYLETEQEFNKTGSWYLPSDDVVIFDENGTYTVNYATDTESTYAQNLDVYVATPAFRVENTAKGEDVTYIYGEKTLVELLNEAENGDYITLLRDCTVETRISDGAFATIKAGMTLDLGEKKLEVVQHRIKSGTTVKGQAYITITTTDTVVVKNGTIIAEHPNYKANYPLFKQEGGTFDLVIEDVES